jgi:hypothetical protein
VTVGDNMRLHVFAGPVGEPVGHAGFACEGKGHEAVSEGIESLPGDMTRLIA